MTRDELVECTALLAAVRAGCLDLLEPPVAPLDVLAQQLVAEVASVEEYDIEALWRLVRASAPFAEVDRSDFDEVVSLVSWGIETWVGDDWAPTCTTTLSTGASGPVRGRGWPLSPVAAPSPRPGTIASYSTPTA